MGVDELWHMDSMKFTFSYKKMQCELMLNENEAATARQEVMDLFRDVKSQVEKNDIGSMKYGRTDVNILHVCQYFDWSEVEKCLLEGTLVNGALLTRIVSLINSRSLLGKKSDTDFDNSIFEVTNLFLQFWSSSIFCCWQIYDNYFEDFCVIVNANTPIPANSVLRIRDNRNTKVFRYLSVKDDGETRSEGDIEIPREQPDPRTGPKVPIVPKSRVFTNSRLRPGSSTSRKTQQQSTPNEKPQKQQQQKRPKSSSTPKISKQWTENGMIIKTMMTLLRDESVVQAIKEQIPEPAEEDEDYAAKVNDIIWTTMVSSLPKGSVSPSSDQCRELYHKHVCQQYFATITSSNSFSEACSAYSLFSLIHSKILLIFERFNQFQLEEKFLCCQCLPNRGDIQKIRIDFKNRKYASSNVSQWKKI